MKNMPVAVPAGPFITLTYRVPNDRRQELIAFLQSAISLYEEPGGIRVALYESVDEPGLFCELVAYTSQDAYDLDQVRVEEDARMKAMLAAWHQFFDGPLEVPRMTPVDVRAAAGT